MPEFYFSYNVEVKKYIDKSVGKVQEGGNYRSFNENWVPDKGPITDVEEKVKNGAALCAWHMVGNRRVKRNTGCVQAGLIILDIDNQAPHKGSKGEKVQKQELTIEQCRELEICKKYLSLAYKSPSHTEAWPRFRLVFGLAKPIIDTNFYQWFTRKLAKQVPGSDIRATQVPNLFYGAKDPADVFCITDKYIPEQVIDDAFREFSSLPAEEATASDPFALLQNAPSPDGIELQPLLSKSVQNILAGEPVDDRSTAMAVSFKELIGWSNWARDNGIPLQSDPLDTAAAVFYSIYQYSPELDGKFDRILNSIQDAESLAPAICLAAEEGELAAWRKLRKFDKVSFDKFCPDQIKTDLTTKKPTPKDSLLNLDFDLSSDEQQVKETKTSTSTSTTPPDTVANNTPQSPTQLVNIQKVTKQFSENDIADIIVKNYGDDFLFDSGLDEFFAYDDDEGVWFLNDEQHIKRRIVNALDTFVASGIVAKYNSATISSIFHILKAKLLRSFKGGRLSIWQSGRGKIPFQNGVLDAATLDFSEGNHKKHYFQTKLPFKYDKTPNCPEILKWLEWSVGKDKMILVRAFCRAVLTGYTTGEKFLHLIGPGGSGKSTLQQLLIALAGYTGTHTSDLETIETNRFECHSLIGKRLLLLTDEASFSRRLDTLKKLTSSSDTLRAERKYGKEVINFKPELLVSIASNEHISSSDISSGLERRRLTIVMDKVVDPSKRRNLISVFPDRVEGEFVPELPGFAAWLLEMSYSDMKDVLANPTKYCTTLTASNLDALVFNNPICAFLADCCLYAPNSATPLGSGAFRPSVDESERGYFVKNAYTEVYAAYVNYCKSNGYKHSAKARFIDRLKETTNHVVKIPGIAVKYQNGRAVVTGIRLKPYDVTTDRAASGPNRLPSPIEWADNQTIWDKAFNDHDAKKA